ncbi:MAG: S-layer protein, partial [Methanothrix sp.]|nr:S-layer protein [Methanothrix sp.]
MKSLVLPAILASFLLAAFAGSAYDAGVRGEAATNASDSFTWTPQNFAGFYYDADKNLGTEVLVATLTEGRKLSGDEPYGLAYRTTAQMDNFDFENWGSYYVMGFLGKKCLAGYAENSDFSEGDQLLYKESDDPNSLAKGQLEEILIDQDDEMTVTCGTPIKLAEGYGLIVRSIQPRQGMANLDLLKDGAVVDTKVVSPSKDSATIA